MSGYKLHIINFDFYGGDVNAFLLETDRYVILIDTSVASARETVRKALNGAKLAGKTLLLLNTHAHWDHAALNGYLKEQYGAVICGHPGALELCDKDRQYQIVYGPYLHALPGESTVYWDEFAFPAPPEKFFRGGEVIEDEGFRLRVLDTPGHSADSLSYFEEYSGVLFAGDAVQENGFDGNSPYYCDAKAYLRSVSTLAELQPTAVLCGHGMVQGARASGEFLGRSVEIWHEIDRAVDAAAGQSLQQAATEIAERFGWNYSMHILTTVAAHREK